VILSPLEC